MNNKMTIPTQIHVGQVERSDTYTGKLGYVIYTDNKGVKRKETSWEGWRDKNIIPLDLTNVPTEGFVLNKGVGGVRQSYGWNARNEYIRVFDPRGFEFEISVANLLYILQECTSIKGKGLEGEFVYAWDGKDLVLLPTTTEEYKNSQDFTTLKSLKVSAKTLIPGGTYLTKNQETIIFLGKLDHYQMAHPELENPESKSKYYKYDREKSISVKSKIFVFVDSDGKHIFESGATKLAKVLNDQCVPNFAELMDDYWKSKYGSKPIELIFKPNPALIVENKENWYQKFEIQGGSFIQKDGKYVKHNLSTHEDYDRSGVNGQLQQDVDGNYKRIIIGYQDSVVYDVRMDNEGIIIQKQDTSDQYKYSTYRPSTIKDRWGSYGYETEDQILGLPVGDLFVKLESGSEIEYSEFKTTYY